MELFWVNFYMWRLIFSLISSCKLEICIFGKDILYFDYISNSLVGFLRPHCTSLRRLRAVPNYPAFSGWILGPTPHWTVGEEWILSMHSCKHVGPFFCWFHLPQGSIHSGSNRNREGGPSTGGPGYSTHFFHSYAIGQNSVPWSHPLQRSGGRSGKCHHVPREERRYWAIAASATPL